MNRIATLPVLFLFALAPTVPAAELGTVRVGAKNFTEQEILGELVAQLIERHTDLTVERRFGLGGTGICHSALVRDQIDIYVEYTGTALVDILEREVQRDRDTVFQTVARAYRENFDLEWLPPVGFNNTYALAIRAETAADHGWTSVSDLADAAGTLTAGFTSEFVTRPDGYPALQRAYALSFGRTMDMDPGLMYRALADGQVDLISAFATDGRIEAYALHLLVDDRGVFPPYDAAPVLRRDTLARHPEIRDALAPLAGTIDDAAMRKLNHDVDELRLPPSRVAREWIEARQDATAAVPQPDDPTTIVQVETFGQFLARQRPALLIKTLEHLRLTGIAMFISVLVGIPGGIIIHRHPRARGTLVALTETVQTIPSLAMLAFLFAVYGVLGTIPAITALVLYALLPIVVNTYTGLQEVSPAMVEAANSLGMSYTQRLRIVELPLALPVVIAGIRTSTVWTVGIATLSTYIGAGGLGDFISRGLARNDSRLTLLGAVPAAAMAIALSLGIRLVERKLRKWA